MSTPDLAIVVSNIGKRDTDHGDTHPQSTVKLPKKCYGIDVSHRQKALDWPIAAASGLVDFAFIKLTEGATWKDPFSYTHAVNARRAGVPCGPYHYARPELDDARLEATEFAVRLTDIERDRNAPFELRPVLDFEHRGSTKSQTQWALDWYNRVEELTGYKAILYTYYNFARVFKPSVSHIDLWLADYRKLSLSTSEAVKPFGKPLIHQFTGTGRVPGYSRDIDRNVAPDLDVLRNEPVVIDLSVTVRELREELRQARLSADQMDKAYTTLATERDDKRREVNSLKLKVQQLTAQLDTAKSALAKKRDEDNALCKAFDVWVRGTS